MDKHTTTMVAAWFGAALITLIFSLCLLIYLSFDRLVIPNAQNFKLFSSLPGGHILVSDEVGKDDGRAKIIEDFFKRHNSVLSNYGQNFAKAADQYSLDWRLMPAIAMQESNGGKKVIKNSYNPFGYGIYGDLVIRFSSWEEAIERVAKALREDYLNQGLRTPFEIMTKYTPPSLAKGGVWADGVSSFMEELK